MLPIELTLLNDLPVAADVDRARRSLGGVPPVAAYFPDDGAYPPEGDSSGFEGGARADVILRAPVSVDRSDQATSLRIRRLSLEITNGPKPNRVVLSAGLAADDARSGARRSADAWISSRREAFRTSRRDVSDELLYTFSVSSDRRVRAVPRREREQRQPYLGARQGHAGVL